MRRIHEGERVAKKDIAILESLVEKYGAKGVEVAINRLNEDINKSELTQYIGGKMFINEIDFNNLPISSVVSISNNYWKELANIYGYSPRVTFKKIEKDVWKLVSVLRTNGIGRPSSDIKVNDGIEVSIKEILKHNVYSFSGKKYEHDNIVVNIPLYKDNGDMNVLYMYNGGQEFRYDNRISLSKLLKEVENNNAHIKFSTTKQDGTIVINIHYGRNTYFLRCYETEFNDFCDKHNIYIYKSNFNTYL